MQVTFGKHEGKSTQLITLKFPEYVHWALGQRNPGALTPVNASFRRHILALDGKPLQRTCHGCTSDATRGSFYRGTTDPLWWCGQCDPYQEGANPGKLTTLNSYVAALQYVEFTCAGRQKDFRDIIKTLAVARGLPARVGEPQARTFLGP